MAYVFVERRVFKFGSNSVALIVPKRWLDKSGLKPSSTVYVSESESGNLIVSPKAIARQEVERVVTSRTRPAFLERWVGIHYMYGVGRLRIYSSDGFTKAQLEGVESKINAECPGFEITSQSNKDVVMEDLTDIKEISIEKVVGRIRSLINEELMELGQGDPKSVPRIEKLVNRFYMLGMRYINITQAKDALMYFGILEFLERISDKLNTMASQFSPSNSKIFEELKEQFDLCFVALGGDEKAIERVAELREAIQKKASGVRPDRLYGRLIMEACDGISGIAEFGLRAENAGSSGMT